MTIRYFDTSIIVSAPGASAVIADESDTIIVETGVTLGSRGQFGSGIFGSLGIGFVDVQVQGTVFGTDYGILLNSATESHDVYIGATGRVMSEGTGIRLIGNSIDLENAGVIRADTSVWITGYARILNTGSITSTFGEAIFAESGRVELVNTGTIRSDNLAVNFTGFDGNTIWNTGLMIGDVALGYGNDLYQGGGTVTGIVNGGSGDDTLIGGDRDDLLFDPYGANWIGGGNGNDTIWVGVFGPGMQTSHVFGGIIGGADTAGSDVLRVFNDGVMGANIFLSAGTAMGSVTRTSDGAIAAWITGFENAVGTNVADAIIGSSAANAIEGGNGGDWMVGNGGADRFVFRSASDADAGDQIRDFRRSEGDRIDLSGIDANVATTTNDAFIFRATRTSNAAGEAVVTNFGNSARVDLYTDADNIVDGTFIVVYGEAGVTNLQANDFIL